jgi:hypothetical protein
MAATAARSVDVPDLCVQPEQGYHKTLPLMLSLPLLMLSKHFPTAMALVCAKSPRALPTFQLREPSPSVKVVADRDNTWRLDIGIVNSQQLTLIASMSAALLHMRRLVESSADRNPGFPVRAETPR